MYLPILLNLPDLPNVTILRPPGRTRVFDEERCCAVLCCVCSGWGRVG